MRPVGADRIAGIGTSIFTEITALAVKHEAVNLGQGFPDFPAPDFVKQAAARHIRDDRNQYAASAGVPRLRAALADDWRRLHPDARAVDPATRDHRGQRRDRDAARRGAGDRQPGRRGDRVRARVRRVRARRRDGGRRGARRAARAARLALRSRSSGGGVRAAHARADPEHAPQPDGQGVLARRAGGDRGAVPAPRRAGDQRRGLLRDPVRRRRARPDRDAARDGRPHDHDRQHGQDVQRHRLEGRLDDRVRRR